MEFQGKSQSLVYFVKADNEDQELTPLDYLSQLEGISEPSAFYCERPVFAKLVQSKCLEARRSAEPIVLLITHLKVLDAESVSYTHLDVYKRQDSDRGTAAFPRLAERLTSA